MRVSAKAKVTSVGEPQYRGARRVEFSANYSDPEGNEINKEWSEATPVFNLAFVVKESIAESYKLGDAVTVYIEHEGD